jgi:predicted phage tail protein
MELIMINSNEDIFVIGNKGSKKPKEPKEDKNTLFSKQIARIIDVISEGEITKFGDSDDIYKATYFNEIPVKDSGGTILFEGVELDSRKGTDSQSYMRDFDNIENESTVNVEVTKTGGAILRSVSDLDTDDIRITLSFPALMKTSSKGDVEKNAVKIKITITPNGGSEQPVVDGSLNTDNPGYIYGKCTSEYKRHFILLSLF